MEYLKAELVKMGVHCRTLRVLREKDGITVARAVCADGSYVLKCFCREEFCREIDNYKMLASLGVPTLTVAAATGRALLLEDADGGERYRLGVEQDLDTPEIAERIAGWYRQLHQKGYGYLERNRQCSLYEENALITPENLAQIRRATNTGELAVWRMLERDFEKLKGILDRTRYTITYNDFYYTNLAVARDGQSALMFDYNFLGKGYACADVRNVCTALTERARGAFLAAYGEVDAVEAALDEVMRVLVTLYLAVQRPRFLSWAEDVLTELKTVLSGKVERLLSTI